MLAVPASGGPPALSVILAGALVEGMGSYSEYHLQVSTETDLCLCCSNKLP